MPAERHDEQPEIHDGWEWTLVVYRAHVPTGGDNDFNYEFHTLLIQTFAHG